MAGTLAATGPLRRRPAWRSRRWRQESILASSSQMTRVLAREDDARARASAWRCADRSAQRAGARSRRAALDALIGRRAVWSRPARGRLRRRSSTGAQLARSIGGRVFVCGAVALRRRNPVAAVALGGATLAPAGARRLRAQPATRWSSRIVIVVYSLGAYTEGRDCGWRSRSARCCAAAGVLVDPAQNAGRRVLRAVFTIGAPMLFGQLLRNRTRLNLALHERAQRAERGRAARGRGGGAAASGRGSRASCTTSSPRRLGDGRPGGRGAAADQDRPRARERRDAADREHRPRGADEMRRLLGVLRREDEELALAPQPTLAASTASTWRATARDCRSSSPSTATPAPLPPASTWPPTGSCRRRSTTPATPASPAARPSRSATATELISSSTCATTAPPRSAPAARPARARRPVRRRAQRARRSRAAAGALRARLPAGEGGMSARAAPLRRPLCGLSRSPAGC